MRQPFGLSAEKCEPMRLMTALGLGEGDEDGALFARTARRETTIDVGLGAFVDEVSRPAASFPRGGDRCGLGHTSR